MEAIARNKGYPIKRFYVANDKFSIKDNSAEWKLPKRLPNPIKESDISRYYAQTIGIVGTQKNQFRSFIPKRLKDRQFRRDRLRHIREKINSSKWILKLEEDWDGQGAQPYKESTWNRATDFVYRNAYWLWKHEGVLIPAPNIEPGPDGSIDIHWKTSRFELLINVPEDEGTASFYGDNHSGNRVRGQIDIDKYNNGLLLWLKQ